MKKKMLFSLMSIALVGALVAGGIYAYFSDIETSTGNTFTAGTLDVKIDGFDDPNVVAVDIGPLKPTDTGGNSWNVTNEGNIAGNFTLTVSAITDDEGTNPEPETDTTPPGDLSGQLKVILYIDANGNGAFDAGDTELYGDGSGGKALLSGMPGGYDPADPGTGGASPVKIELDWELPNQANNNDVQGDSSTFDITFTLNQA